MTRKQQTHDAAPVLTAAADALWRDCPHGEWIAVWRLESRLDVPPANQLQRLEPQLPGISDAYPAAVKEKLLDACIALLVNERRAETRIDCDVEDVRFLEATGTQKRACKKTKSQESRALPAALESS